MRLKPGSGTVTLEELLESIPRLSEDNKDKIRLAFDKADDDCKFFIKNSCFFIARYISCDSTLHLTSPYIQRPANLA